MAGRPKNPYATLGVHRDVDDKALKTAYRKLAHENHPDRNTDDPAAEDRFKEISAAYAVLSDPKRRKAFDEFGEIALDPNFNAEAARHAHRGFGGGGGGHAFGGGGGAAGFGDFGSLFEEFFSGPEGGRRRPQARAPRPARGRDREITLELALEDVIEGCERSVTINRNIAPGAARRESLRVQVPAGVCDGARIRLTGKGDEGQQGGRAGDLLCRIRLKRHKLFRVEGVDLQLDVPISLKEALLGAEVEIPTLSGRVKLNVPAGTDGGARMRLRGKGLPRGEGESPGDLYVTLHIRVPTNLSDEDRERLSELGDLGPLDLRDHLFED